MSMWDFYLPPFLHLTTEAPPPPYYKEPENKEDDQKVKNADKNIFVFLSNRI